MATKRIKITVQVLYVNPYVWCCLRSIHMNKNMSPVCLLNHFLNRIDGPQGIGDMHNRYELGLIINHSNIFFPDDFPFIIYRNYPQYSFAFFTKDLPGNNITMVLHG